MKVSASKEASGKGSCSAAPGHQLDPTVQAGPGHVPPALGEHADGEVDADDVCRCARRQLERHTRRARCHIEDATWGRRHDPIDHGPAPATVLRHGEDLGQAVVALGERGEQILGESIPIVNDVRQCAPSGGGRPHCRPGPSGRRVGRRQRSAWPNRAHRCADSGPAPCGFRSESYQIRYHSKNNPRGRPPTGLENRQERQPAKGCCRPWWTMA